MRRPHVAALAALLIAPAPASAATTATWKVTALPPELATASWLGADGTVASGRRLRPPGGTPLEVPTGGYRDNWDIVGLLDDGRAIAFRLRALVLRNPSDENAGSYATGMTSELAFVAPTGGIAALQPFTLGAATVDFGDVSDATGLRVQAETEAGGWTDWTGPRLVDGWAVDTPQGLAYIGPWTPLGVAGDGTIAGAAYDRGSSSIPSVRRVGIFTARAGGAPAAVQRWFEYGGRDWSVDALGTGRDGFFLYRESLTNSVVPDQPPGYVAYVSTPGGRTQQRCSGNQTVADDGSYLSWPCSDSLMGEVVRSAEVRAGRDGAVVSTLAFDPPVAHPMALVGGYVQYGAQVDVGGGAKAPRSVIAKGATRKVLHDWLGTASPGADVRVVARNARGQYLLAAGGKAYLAALERPITGAVASATGLPVAGATVTVSGPGTAPAAAAGRAATAERRVVRTDARGRFSVPVTGDAATVAVAGACIRTGATCATRLALALGLDPPAPLVVRSSQPVGPLVGGTVALRVRKGATGLRLRCLRASRCSGPVAVRSAKGVVLARGRLALGPRRTGRVPLALTKAGRTALKGGRTVAATARATVAGATVAVPVTLRRA